MKNENDDWLFNLVFWPTLAIGATLLVCDLMGRLAVVLQQERPMIERGFVILLWVVAVVWCHLKYAKQTAELKTKIESERDAIRKTEERIDRELLRVQTNFDALVYQFREYRWTAEKLVTKLEESSKLKQPVETPEAVQAAVSEVMNGDAA